MRQIEKCLVCDSAEHRLAYASTYAGSVTEAHHYFLAQRRASAHGDIRKCAGCGFVFTSPQFDEQEYDLIYSRIGADAAPDPAAAGPGAVASERRFLRLRDAVARRSSIGEPFLDFGCGDGTFLRVAGGPASTGFEVGTPGRRPGPNGSSILCGRWQDVAGSAAMPWGSQAFVTAFDVFEHLPALQRDVESIRRVIRPAGHLYITVPDIGSAMARLTGGKWNMLLLEHLWYFNARTLDAFMARCGFRALSHQSVPYDASVEHVLKRLAETLGLRAPALPAALRRLVAPIPAGVLFAAYQRQQ